MTKNASLSNLLDMYELDEMFEWRSASFDDDFIWYFNYLT